MFVVQWEENRLDRQALQSRRPSGRRSTITEINMENQLKLHHRIFDLICKRFVVGWVGGCELFQNNSTRI